MRWWRRPSIHLMKNSSRSNRRCSFSRKCARLVKEQRARTKGEKETDGETEGETETERAIQRLPAAVLLPGFRSRLLPPLHHVRSDSLGRQ